MQQLSGLVHKKHRRGKKRRDKLRLVARVCFYALLLACAAGLSAGVIHVVERPVAPFEGMGSVQHASAGEAATADALAPLPVQDPEALAAAAELASATPEEPAAAPLR